MCLENRFPTDEHVISLENGEVLMSGIARPKLCEDIGRYEEVDKSKCQSWDSTVLRANTC